MREVTRDPGSLGDDSAKEITGELIESGPSETELVQVALLMRLYDLGMAILTELNESRADEVFEAHERGEHFNPPIFIPTPESTEQ